MVVKKNMKQLYDNPDYKNGESKLGRIPITQYTPQVIREYNKMYKESKNNSLRKHTWLLIKYVYELLFFVFGTILCVLYFSFIPMFKGYIALLICLLLVAYIISANRISVHDIKMRRTFYITSNTKQE